MRYILCLLIVSAMAPLAATFSTHSPTHAKMEQSIETDRRDFVKQASLAFGAAVLWSPLPSYAKDEVTFPTKEVVTKAFDPIRYELQDPEGGVAYMQNRIDEKDWAGLLAFTKTYDQELRKARIGKAKKLLQSKELKEKGTEFANAVTFDLIGINRSSRSGQESVDGANKYLQELRDDVSKFLALESTIETEG